MIVFLANIKLHRSMEFFEGGKLCPLTVISRLMQGKPLTILPKGVLRKSSH